MWIGVRLKKWHTDANQPYVMGGMEYDPEGTGDIIGGMLWPNRKGLITQAGAPKVAARPIPAWSFGFPSSIFSVDKKKKISRAIPTWNGFLQQDLRFDPLAVVPATKQLYPVGTPGIVLKSTEETTQEEIFFPADGKLIAVHADGEPTMGSLVADLDKDDKIDPERLARLQSALRVIKNPKGIGSLRLARKEDNLLALHMGLSGRQDSIGGFLSDGDEPIIGGMSLEDGGPFLPGFDEKDTHNLGKDDDDHPIHSLHFHTDALFHSGQKALIPVAGKFNNPPAGLQHGFTRSSELEQDAPLEFDEDNAYIEPPPYSLTTRVHLRFDTGSEHNWFPLTQLAGPTPGVTPKKPGLWRWIAEVLEHIIIDDRPGNMEQKQLDTDKAPIVKNRLPGSGHKPIKGAFLDSAYSAILARPQRIANWEPDHRNYLHPSPSLIRHIDQTTPITGRIEAWGHQDPKGWNYTEDPSRGRYVGGTACGGFALMSPEWDLSDISHEFGASGTSFSGISTSKSFFTFTPNETRLAFGLPDLNNCTICKGFSAGPDSASGDLVFYRHIKKVHELTASEDTYVDEANAGTNYGSDTTAQASLGKSDDETEALFKFDPSALSGTVTKARLKLNATSGTGNVCVLIAPGSWSEGTVTWSTRPTYSSASEVSDSDWHDSFTNETLPNANNNQSGISVVSSGGGSPFHYGWIRPDESLVPSGATIISARISVFKEVASTDATGTINVHEADATWDEATLTWNNQPGVGSLISTFRTNQSDAIGTEYKFDITSVAQKWANGQTNNGFRLSWAENGKDIQFTQQDQAAPAGSDPEIEIVYTFQDYLVVCRGPLIVGDNYFDIPARMVQGWVDGTVTNDGFIVKTLHEDDSVINTSENADSATHPILELTICEDEAEAFRHQMDGGYAPKHQSPTQLSAGQDDYDIGAGETFRLSSTSGVTITGIQSGDTSQSRRMRIFNTGSNDITFANQSTSSDPGNRIITGTGANKTVSADESIDLEYHPDDLRWRILTG